MMLETKACVAQLFDGELYQYSVILDSQLAVKENG